MTAASPDPAANAADREGFINALRQAVAPWRLDLSAAQESLLFDHFIAVAQTNRVMNLTRIVDPAEAAVKHYADSLAAAAWARQASGAGARRVLDVGTGAGFPAIPLAAAEPEWSITAMDGTRKKVDFVRRVAGQLGLTRVAARHARADKNAPTGDFDLVLARAVTRLDPLLSWLAPWGRSGAHLLAWKSAALTAEETEAGERLVHKLRLAPLPPFAYTLPDAAGPMHRVLLVYRMP